MHRSLVTRLLAIASVAAVLAACGSDDDSSSDTTAAATTAAPAASTTADADTTVADATTTVAEGEADTTGAPADVEPFTVRMTTLSLCNEVPYWAISHGFFEAEGIEIELVPAQGGAAGLDAVESGAADIAFANPVAILKAIDAGRDLTVVAGTGVSQPDNNAVIVAADSDVQSPKDLEGDTIGINEIGGLGWVMTRAWIEADGGDPEAAEFVALGFPELVPAVQGGQVDAAQVTAAQGAQAAASTDLRVIGNPFYEVVGAIPTAFYAAKSSFVEENADGMERWARAFAAAVADFDDEANREAQFAEMSEVCKTEPAVLAATPYTFQHPQIDMEGFQKELDLLMSSGVVEEGKVAADLVAPFAQG